MADGKVVRAPGDTGDTGKTLQKGKTLHPEMSRVLISLSSLFIGLPGSLPIDSCKQGAQRNIMKQN